jgi:hypothetical protein
MPRISDTKIERALLKMQKEAEASLVETSSQAEPNEYTKFYRMGRAHMILDVIKHLQSEDFCMSLDRD